MNVAILDSGVGNLHSLQKALVVGGAGVRVAPRAGDVGETDAIVLPGVGSFAAAAARIASGRDEIARRLRDGLPCLGICLGMQLLLDDSDEGPGSGLGIIPGRVVDLSAPRVPHMGWNQVQAREDSLFRGIDGMFAYFAHGYVAAPLDPERVIAETSYGGATFPAAVRLGNTFGVQFHPEKSGDDGLRLIANFLEIVQESKR